jgi:hypothetical protein
MNLLHASSVLAGVSWLVFLVWYTVRAKWWTNCVGQNTMLVSFVVFLLILNSYLLYTYEWFTVHPVPSTFVYLLTTSAAIQRIYLMERAQRES